MFREMSEIEITIRAIEKVRMISIYELTGFKDGDTFSCPAISVIYGQEKSINLSTLDKGFEMLVNRVFEIYGSLEDRDSVAIDEVTLEILNSGLSRKEEAFLQEYYDNEPAANPILPDDAVLVQRFLPITEYFMNALIKIMGTKQEITGRRNGWRGRSVLNTLLNGEAVKAAVRIVRTDTNRYSAEITGFLRRDNKLTIDYVMGNDELEVSYASDVIDLRGESRYRFLPEKCKISHEAYRDGTIIFCEDEELEPEYDLDFAENEKKLVPEMNTPTVVYRLPWDMKYIRASRIIGNGACIAEQTGTTWLYGNAEYSYTACGTRVTNNERHIGICVSSMLMSRMIINGKRRQTYFEPQMGNKTDKYRNILEGRWFVDEFF